MRKLLKKYAFAPETWSRTTAILPCRRAWSWNRASASHRPMAKQSGGKFASADPTQREENARVQKPRIRTKISLNACSHLRHLQRPTPSHFCTHAPTFRAFPAVASKKARRSDEILVLQHLGVRLEAADVRLGTGLAGGGHGGTARRSGRHVLARRPLALQEAD